MRIARRLAITLPLCLTCWSCSGVTDAEQRDSQRVDRQVKQVCEQVDDFFEAWGQAIVDQDWSRSNAEWSQRRQELVEKFEAIDRFDWPQEHVDAFDECVSGLTETVG